MKRRREREESEWLRAAWMVCQFLSPFTKKRLNPQKLLRGMFGDSAGMSGEEKKQRLKERLERERRERRGA